MAEIEDSRCCCCCFYALKFFPEHYSEKDRLKYKFIAEGDSENLYSSSTMSNVRQQIGKVKNRAPAPIQITAEQILSEVR